jgi:hypothetical protein
MKPPRAGKRIGGWKSRCTIIKDSAGKPGSLNAGRSASAEGTNIFFGRRFPQINSDYYPQITQINADFF